MEIFAGFVVVLLIQLTFSSSELEEGATSGQKFLVEGKVTIPYTADQDWVATTRVVLDGGLYLGFLK